MQPTKVRRPPVRGRQPVSRLVPAIVGLALIGAVLAAQASGGGSFLAIASPSDAATSEPVPSDKMLAYEQAHPHGTWGPMLPGFEPGETAEPLLPEPDWAKTVQEIPADERSDGPVTLRHADSVWQDGSVPEYGARLWDEFYVWTGLASEGDPATPEIGTYVLNATDPPTLALDAVYPCTRALGHLAIVGATATEVTFTSQTGVSGSFDLTTHAWTFDDTSPEATVAP
jgi:hypothetical protein